MQQQSAPAPAEEASVEPATAVENQAAPAGPEASAGGRPVSAFQAGRRVSVVEQTCCGGFAVKSKVCAIQ